MRQNPAFHKTVFLSNSVTAEGRHQSLLLASAIVAVEYRRPVPRQPGAHPAHLLTLRLLLLLHDRRRQITSRCWSAGAHGQTLRQPAVHQQQLLHGQFMDCGLMYNMPAADGAAARCRRFHGAVICTAETQIAGEVPAGSAGVTAFYKHAFSTCACRSLVMPRAISRSTLALASMSELLTLFSHIHTA